MIAIAFGTGYLVFVVAFCLCLYEAITNAGQGMYNVQESE